MPAKLDRCVQKLMKQGKSESSAFAICNAQMKKEKIKDWRVLEFFVPIEEKISDGEDFIIRGVAINETTTLNNIKYIAEELQKAAPTFRNVPILLDHRNEVSSIVGRTTENVNFNSTFNRIDFEAKIMDKNIKEMIKDGRIGSVSIGAKVQDLIEEEDGTMKAVGIRGLEISLVAVPGDSHANLAQAIQQGLVLKEYAKIDKLNLEKVEMADEEQTEVETSEEEAKESTEPEEEKPEEEKTEEKVQNINVKVDTSEISDMKKQISELKELLIEKKKLKEQAEDEEDETKGEVSTENEEAIENLDKYIVERARSGFSLYRNYSNEGADTNLKRLVR